MIQWIKSKPWLYQTLMKFHKIYMSIHEMLMHFAWHLFVHFPLKTKKVVFGNFFGGGFGGALVESFEVDRASPEELVEMAQRQGSDLRRYQV